MSLYCLCLACFILIPCKRSMPVVWYAHSICASTMIRAPFSGLTFPRLACGRSCMLPNISHLETLIMCGSACTFAHILLHADMCTYTRTSPHACAHELKDLRTGRTPTCALEHKSGNSKSGSQGSGYTLFNMCL